MTLELAAGVVGLACLARIYFIRLDYHRFGGLPPMSRKARFK